MTREELVKHFQVAGAGDVVSYLATGNVSFTASPALLMELIGDVERAIGSTVGRATPVFVRSLEYLRSLDFPDADIPCEPVSERLVLFFYGQAPELDLPLVRPRGDAYVFAADDRQAYGATCEVDGRVVSGPAEMLERRAGQRVTSRNWNTIERVVRKLESP